MGGRKVNVYLHASLTEVISLLRVKPILARVTFQQGEVFRDPWKRGSQGSMPGQAGHAAVGQRPNHTGPGPSPLCSTPPLPARLGAGLSAPAAAVSPEDPAASPWVSQLPGPGTSPQHPASPSPRTRWAGPLRQRKDESLPQPPPPSQPRANPQTEERPRDHPLHFPGVHTGLRPRLLSRALMAE